VLTPVLVLKKIEFIFGVGLTLNTKAGVELTLTLTLTPKVNSLNVTSWNNSMQALISMNDQLYCKTCTEVNIHHLEFNYLNK